MRSIIRRWTIRTVDDCDKDIPCSRRRLLVQLLRRWEEVYPFLDAKNRKILTEANQLYMATGKCLKDEQDDEVFV